MARFVSALLILLFPYAAQGSTESELAEVVWKSRCSACHTIGSGDDIGPDLKGVTERRDKAWLVSFIQSSQALISAGDPTATELFELYDRRKMPDHPYEDAEIEAILAYIEAGGPVAAARFRPAADATLEEIRAGRALFVRGTSGEASCASCHTVDSSTRLAGLYLGGSLARTFSKYRDPELERALVKDRGPICQPALDPEASFLIRAYLRHVDMNGESEPDSQAMFPLLSLGLTALILGAGWFLANLASWRRPRIAAGETL